MKAKVYHVIKPTFFPDRNLLKTAYKLVAEVECETPDDAYRLTQNIDEPWTKNKEITSLVGDKCRSTSVGDVIEMWDTFHMCEMLDWSEFKFPKEKR